MKATIQQAFFFLLILASTHLIGQNIPDISGTWYINGQANSPATVKQNGNKISLSYSENKSSGYFTTGSQIFMKEWNAYGDLSRDLNTITWNNQVWKRHPDQVEYPDISGSWYIDGESDSPCQISQNSFNLNFSFSNNSSTGYYYEANKIYATEWAAYGEVSQDHNSIVWSNQTWTRSSKTTTTNTQSQGPNRFCRFELSTFYYAAQSLGAVWGRSATEPAIPTPIAIAAMKAHLGLAINSYLEYANCLQFDFKKLKALHANIHTMSSAQITRDVEIVIKELQSIIGSAPFSCDHGVSPSALYVGGIHLGAAQAWASSRQCMPTPMPANIATVIANHLSTANAALLPYEPCLHGQKTNGTTPLAFDFSTFAMVPLASLNSIEAHTFIVGIETQLLWAIALSDCCCSCSPSTPVQGTSACDETCKEYCRQQGYQKGRFNGKTICLLGQVSGGNHEGCDCSN
ncbi:MAG: hypothetical protein ABI851_12465 [Saprospiraceae bacterium]